MNIIPEMVKILLPAAESMVKEMATVRDIKFPYVVNLSMMEEIKFGKFSVMPDVVIEAGNPPILHLSYLLFLQFLNEPDAKIRRRLKNRIKQLVSLSVSKLPRMVHTLSNTPPAEVLAIKDGARNVFKSNQKDKFIFYLPDSSIEYTTEVVVTAREIHTNESVTLRGDNESYLRQKARAQLTALVEMNEILAYQLEQESAPPVESPPVKLAIRLTEVGPEVHTLYEKDIEPELDGVPPLPEVKDE